MDFCIFSAFPVVRVGSSGRSLVNTLCNASVLADGSGRFKLIRKFFPC